MCYLNWPLRTSDITMIKCNALRYSFVYAIENKLHQLYRIILQVIVTVSKTYFIHNRAILAGDDKELLLHLLFVNGTSRFAGRP